MLGDRTALDDTQLLTPTPSASSASWKHLLVRQADDGFSDGGGGMRSQPRTVEVGASSMLS